MDDFTRLTIAYAIVGVLLVIGIPMTILQLRRRKREKLRRRGIKTHGH
jgi:cytochrome c oxidase assembly factor CtaG